MKSAGALLTRRALLGPAATSCCDGQAASSGRDPAGCRIVFDLDPDPKNQVVLDWLKRGGFCRGVEVPWNTPQERLEWLRR